jgi:hypothetical protein
MTFAAEKTFTVEGIRIPETLPNNGLRSLESIAVQNGLCQQRDAARDFLRSHGIGRGDERQAG